MKTPGSHLVHYVDKSGTCHPALVHDPDTEGKSSLTVFTGPGTMTAARGVIYAPWDTGKAPLSWHNDCPNSGWDD